MQGESRNTSHLYHIATSDIEQFLDGINGRPILGQEGKTKVFVTFKKKKGMETSIPRIVCIM